jgi:hypothetical protein
MMAAARGACTGLNEVPRKIRVHNQQYTVLVTSVASNEEATDPNQSSNTEADGANRESRARRYTEDDPRIAWSSFKKKETGSSRKLLGA